MLACLLRFSILCLAASAFMWALVFWQTSLTLAWLGCAAIVLLHAWFLAVEFILVWFVNRHDPAPHASAWQLLFAWGRETFTALQVFAWRQPFFPDVVPDQLVSGVPAAGQRGVVFIHGFVCNRGVWTPWLRALQAEGGVFIAVNLEPVFGGIDSYVPLIDEAVTRVSVATGQAPVLICHSMGGLAARAWLRSMQADGRVRHVVTLGAPHHGTWLGKFSHFANGRQMRLNGDWVSALARDEPPQRRALFTCWYSHCDNVVFPASTASLPGARNLHVPGTAHMGLVQHPRIMQVTLDALRRDSW